MAKSNMFNTNKVTKRAKELFIPIIEKHGLIMWDVELTKLADDYTLSLYLDKEGGIDLNDLEEINGELNQAADKADFIQNAYMFEVSSAGTNRRLMTAEHYKKACGKHIRAKLYKKNEELGTKDITGILVSSDDENITISINDTKYTFNISDISVMKAEF